MRIAYNWLRKYVSVPFSPQELAERLTMLGLEVEGIAPFQKGLEFCKIGQMQKISPHPSAEKLTSCQVDLGDRILSIVCGATNMKEGDNVPIALPGARLPNGGEIKKTCFRGVTSEGMLCSLWELGLGEDRSGLWILPDDAPIGMDLSDYLNITDTIIEVDLTPNRSDCLSHIGIAREIAALTGHSAMLPEIVFPEESGTIHDLIEITITDPELCFRYAAMLITGVTIAPSPLWLVSRLESVGIRSVNNVVDVTNFVLMETGQPLHAFDYDRIQGKKVCIRAAKAGECSRTLDGVERQLDPSMLVIADASNPIAIAGIMGGAGTEVTGNTKNVLIESALFNPLSIRRTSKVLGLSTEASQRFEKGIDHEWVPISAQRAVQLIHDLAGGKVARGAIDVYPNSIQRTPVRVRQKRVNSVLGLDLSAEYIYMILKNLSFTPHSIPGETMDFSPPSFRQDISQEIDLIEEVARFYGYNNILATIPKGSIPAEEKLSRQQRIESFIKDILVGAGFYEVVNFSFTKKNLFDMITMGREDAPPPVDIQNPLTEEQNALRQSILPNLFQNLVFNLSRQNRDMKIFEIGTCFFPLKAGQMPPEEKKRLGILMTGLVSRKHWRNKPKESDIYDLKGIVEFLFDSLGIKEYSFKRVSAPWLDDLASLQVCYKERNLGILGRLSPEAESLFDVKKEVFVSELDFDYIVEMAEAGWYRFKALPKFPPALRDMAIVVEQDVSYQRIIELIREEGSDLLEGVSLFDLYIGPQIPIGKKSLAFSLIYRSEGRTLRDEEVNKVHQQIYARLEKELDVTLR